MEIRGKNKDESIDGTDDDDLIAGLGGDDKIDGKGGEDEIAGGEGKDALTGGPGGDYFVFASKNDLKNENVDVIKDFVQGEDVIGLSYKVFKHMGFGQLQETYFRVGKKAKDDDDHIIFNPANDGLYYDEDGKGGEKAQLFVKIKGEQPIDPNHLYLDMVLSIFDWIVAN
jgi:Ca2+-binding RTX toxin-like protein